MAGAAHAHFKKIENRSFGKHRRLGYRGNPLPGQCVNFGVDRKGGASCSRAIRETLEDITEVLGEKPEIDPTLLGKKMEDGFIPKAPGMKYRHYAPKAEMILFCSLEEKESKKKESEDKTSGKRGTEDRISEGKESEYKVSKRIAEYLEEEGRGFPREKIAVFCAEETKHFYQEMAEKEGIVLKVLGRRDEPLSMTHNLFRILRECDEEGIELILSEGYSEKGIGFALMNRMKKAAGQKIILIK